MNSTIYCIVEFTDSKWRLPRAQFKRLFLYNRVIVTIVYNTKYLIGIYKHTFQILHMFIRRILKMCVINCLILIFLIFSLKIQKKIQIPRVLPGGGW